MYKKVIILTKSSKNKGYCVAGVDAETGEWIRLVSTDVKSHGSLFYNDIKYEDNTCCKPLDVVRIQIKNNVPTSRQPENVLIENGHCWEKIGKCSIEDVMRVHPPESYEFLFGDLNYYVTEDNIGNVKYSLVLIEVTGLAINQVQNSLGKPKTKARFIYGKYPYDYMSVTDRSYYGVPDNIQIGKAILVVSLPDVPIPENKYFKFVAQIHPITS